MKRFYDNDYTLLNKNKELVSKTIWSIETAGGTLNKNIPFEESEILLESDLIKANVSEDSLALHMVVYDVKYGESFVPCNSLSEKQQLELAKEYNLS